MFASWSRTRHVLVATAGAVVLALVSAPSARALEGIQGRHAIFYPSLELVYQHDDNFFLLRDNEVSADTFIIHPHFVVEVPGSRHFLKIDYSPQYRSIDVDGPGTFREPEDDVQHFFELSADLKGSSLFSVEIKEAFTMANLEVHEIDGGQELVKSPGEQFWSNKFDIYFNWEGNRQGATLHLGHHDSEFEDDDTAPRWFEIDEARAGMEYFYKFTPLTSFLVGIEFRDSAQDYTDAFITRTGVPTLDSNRADVYFGFEGELGRTTTGRARLGYANLDYDGSVGANSDYDGLTLEADVTKAFSRWSKLIFGAKRTPYFSAFAVNPAELNTYYVANEAALTFSQQPQGGRVGWSLKGSFQRNNYDTATTDPNGLVAGLKEREDDIIHLRAEVGFHPLEHLSFRLNYRHEERDSNLPSFDYEDNLVIFQVQFGF